jgi:hypothetical protein
LIQPQLCGAEPSGRGRVGRQGGDLAVGAELVDPVHYRLLLPALGVTLLATVVLAQSRRECLPDQRQVTVRDQPGVTDPQLCGPEPSDRGRADRQGGDLAVDAGLVDPVDHRLFLPALGVTLIQSRARASPTNDRSPSDDNPP